MIVLHTAPYQHPDRTDWPSELRVHILACASAQGLGFEYSTARGLLESLISKSIVWDARASEWRESEVNQVVTLMHRARVAIVARPGPWSLGVADELRRYAKYQKSARLHARYGKTPQHTVKRPPYSLLLAEKATIDPRSVLAIQRLGGPFMIWQIGDMSLGMHALLVEGDATRSSWLDALYGQVECKHHTSTRDLPRV